jgi:hypothetical protein
MTIDDRRANAPSAELVGEHQTGWAGSNDENIGLHLNLPDVLRAGLWQGWGHCPAIASSDDRAFYTRAANAFVSECLFRLGRSALFAVWIAVLWLIGDISRRTQ